MQKDSTGCRKASWHMYTCLVGGAGIGFSFERCHHHNAVFVTHADALVCELVTDLGAQAWSVSLHGQMKVAGVCMCCHCTS
jgi:hypothetical protein